MFFGFWLSHVPAERFASFWNVRQASWVGRSKSGGCQGRSFSAPVDAPAIEGKTRFYVSAVAMVPRWRTRFALIALLTRRGASALQPPNAGPAAVYGTGSSTLSNAITSASRLKCASRCITASPPCSAAAAAINASVGGTRW